MVLSDIPKLQLNDIEFKILYTTGEGLCGITLALTTKNNPTNYPLLICKLFKSIQLCEKPNDNIYNKVQNYNITSKLIGIQKLTDKFKYEYIDLEGFKVKGIFENYIYYYEIGGFCNLTQYLSILREFKYENIDYLKKYINDILKSIKKLNYETGILHHDLRTDNIMIKNSYSYYLFNLYNLYLKEKNEDTKKKLLKELNKYIFDKGSYKKILDETILKNTDLFKSGLITINNINVSIIDFDMAYDLNVNFKKYISKYNLNNKNVKDTLQLIYNVWINSDILQILYDLLERISFINCIETNNDNMKDILKYIEDLIENSINEIISNSILKELKNVQLSYIILNNILTMTHNIKSNKEFDILFNYVYTKQYLKDKDYLHYDYIYSKNLAEKYLFINKINLNEKDKKLVYKK